MMKLSFLLASLACALAGNLKAGSLEQAQTDSINTETQIMRNQEVRIQRDEERQFARLRAEAKHDPVAAAEYYTALRQRLEQERAQKYAAQAKQDQAKKQLLSQPLAQGDPIAQISNTYDDEATIRTYLHDSGYNDLSDAEIAKIRTYMKANGIRHVSQLGR